MYQKISTTRATAHICGAMEAETIQKNEASPKSLRVGKTFLIASMLLCFCAFTNTVMGQKTWYIGHPNYNSSVIAKLSGNTLTISGNGNMVDFWNTGSGIIPPDNETNPGGEAPWWFSTTYRNAIQTVVIECGVTNIGQRAFKDCSNLSSITIPNSVTKINAQAFTNCNYLYNITCRRETPPTLEDSSPFPNAPCGRTLRVLPQSFNSYNNSTWKGCGSIEILYDGSVTPATSWNYISNECVANCDNKVYRISVTSGVSYTFSCNDAANFDSQMRLYNNSGNALTNLIDRTPTGGDETIEHQFNYSGYAYVLIKGYNSSSGCYHFGYKEVNPPANDNCSEATSLSCDEIKSGTLSDATPTTSYSDYGTKNDVFYYFTAQNSGNHTITLSNFSNDKDLFLYSNCSATSNLESSTGSISTEETITHNCTAGQTYRIRVVDYSGTGGNFNISLACPPCTTLPNYDMLLSTPTTAGYWMTDQFQGNCDIYVYKIPVTSGNMYKFSVSTAIPRVLDLYDSSGTLIVHMDNGTLNSPDETIEWQAAYTGYVYAKVSGSNYSRFNFFYGQMPKITVSAGSSGNISPNTTPLFVSNNDDKTFTFTPNTCYEIDHVLIDGIVNTTAKANGYYTFSNVTTNHTISVTFKQKQYTITATAGIGGTITTSATVNCGSSKTFYVTPNSYYEIDQVLVDGSVISTAKEDGYYTFSDVTTNHTISVTFKTSSTGVEELQVQTVSIFPNPAKDEIHIKSDLAIERVEICDLAGKQMTNSNLKSINVSALPTGVYLVKVQTDNELIVKKFIKE